MKIKNYLIIGLVVCSLLFSGCGKKEDTTVSGMVVKVDGTKISIVDVDSDSLSEVQGSVTMPSQGDFNPGDFEGSIPSMPEGFDGSAPSMPEGFDESAPSMPEGFNGGFPNGNFSGDQATKDFSANFSDEDITEYDVANAHVSIEIDEGKEAGSVDDITVGSTVTLTINSDSEVTNVLVSKNSGFGGSFFNMGNFPQKNKENS